MQFALPAPVFGRLRRVEGATLRAVDGVDLYLRRGEALGLVGESGCGKSTLGRCIVGLYEPTSGEVALDGRVLPSERTQAERRRIQMVFQDPYASLNPRMTVRQMLAELLRVQHVVPRSEITARSAELLDLVGLGHALAISTKRLRHVGVVA